MLLCSQLPADEGVSEAVKFPLCAVSPWNKINLTPMYLGVPSFRTATTTINMWPHCYEWETLELVAFSGSGGDVFCTMVVLPCKNQVFDFTLWQHWALYLSTNPDSVETGNAGVGKQNLKFNKSRFEETFHCWVLRFRRVTRVFYLRKKTDSRVQFGRE